MHRSAAPSVNFDTESFLQRFWQRRPRLIRDAIAGFHSFIDRRELFALACREDVESRLVLERGGEYPWQVLHGPFRPAFLRRLAPSHWTLLVQNVDLHCAAGAQLLRRFSFIPNWRVDDLMVSCAPPGGSVGAHLDSYDVFLLQAHGRRSWQINRGEYDDGDFIEGLDLRILRKFRPKKEWLLDPGDMLYLPPGIAHHGIAVTDSLTFSVGFRAPVARELALHCLEDWSAAMPDVRFRDPGRRLQTHAGEIAGDDLAHLRAMVRAAAGDDRTLNRRIGCQLTALPEALAPPRPRRPLPATRFHALFRNCGRLVRATACRSAYIHEGRGMVLFINGCDLALPRRQRKFAQQFTAGGVIEYALLPAGTARAELLHILRGLYNQGLLLKP